MSKVCGNSFAVAYNNKAYALFSSRRLRKFIDRGPCYYTHRVKEAIHIRLHPSNINRDSGIEIPEAWMPMIKKHNNKRAVRQRTAEGINHWVIDQQGSKCTNQSCWKTIDHCRASCFIRSRMTSWPHRLKKTSIMKSKGRDLHHTWLHREINEKLRFYCFSPRWITTTFSTFEVLRQNIEVYINMYLHKTCIYHELESSKPTRETQKCFYTQKNMLNRSFLHKSHAAWLVSL